MTGKETWVEPVTEGDGYRFMVRVGKPKDAELAKGRDEAIPAGQTFVA